MASAPFPQGLLHSSGPWFGFVNGAMWQNVAARPLVAQHHEAMGDFHTEQSTPIISTSVKRVMGHLERAQRGAGQLLRQFDAHPRALVDDRDAVGVAQVHDLLGVGVVAGPERVGPQPAQQVEILHYQGPVQAFATDLRAERNQHL